MALDRVVQAMTAEVVHEALCQYRRDLERAAVDRGAGGSRDERVLVARLAADAVEDLLPSLASNDMGPRGGTSVARMKSANSCTSAPAGWALSPRSSGSNHRAARMIEERRVPPAGAALDYLAGTADDRCGVALAASSNSFDRSTNPAGALSTVTTTDVVHRPTARTPSTRAIDCTRMATSKSNTFGWERRRAP
jgi:hypothetical protein